MKQLTNKIAERILKHETLKEPYVVLLKEIYLGFLAKSILDVELNRGDTNDQDQTSKFCVLHFLYFKYLGVLQ